MNNDDIIVRETSHNDIDRCNCPTCMGRAGTVRVCLNSRKLASRTAGNALAKTAGLLLLACFFLQGQARACSFVPVTKSTHPGRDPMGDVQKSESPVYPDYYQSSDNPFDAD